MWPDANIKLTGGPHGIPPPVVRRIQRDRLLKRLTATVAEHGYADTTVRKILDGSGISRRTCYELYTDTESCFLDAYGEIAGELLRRVAAGFQSQASPEQRIAAAVGALVDFCIEEPEAARVGIVEVYGAGAKARALRSETMRELAATLAPAFAELRPQESDPAFSAHGMLGGVLELLFEALRSDDVDALRAVGERLAKAPTAGLPAD